MNCTLTEKAKLQKTATTYAKWGHGVQCVDSDFELLNSRRRYPRKRIPQNELTLLDDMASVDFTVSFVSRTIETLSESTTSENQTIDFEAFYQDEKQGFDRQWRNSRTPLVVVKTVASPAQGDDVGVSIIGTRDPEEAVGIQDLSVDWRFSAEEILRRLEDKDTPWAERIDAVLFAETTGFDTVLKPRLVRGLQGFCEAHRFSADEETITAVGAAIRKYAMNLSDGNLDAYASLFRPTSTEALSCDVELELAKAIGWRLVRAESGEWEHSGELESRLTDLASDYLSVRLILQENYASIVMHALIAICLLRGERREELINRGRELKIEWFTDLLARRMGEVAKKLEGKRRSDLERMIELLRQPVAQEA